MTAGLAMCCCIHTAQVRHGWNWTGDLGYADGYLYFAGRSGDWIRVDGENTSALLTERILRRHPAIVAAAVLALADSRGVPPRP